MKRLSFLRDKNYLHVEKRTKTFCFSVSRKYKFKLFFFFLSLTSSAVHTPISNGKKRCGCANIVQKWCHRIDKEKTWQEKHWQTAHNIYIYIYIYILLANANYIYHFAYNESLNKGIVASITSANLWPKNNTHYKCVTCSVRWSVILCTSYKSEASTHPILDCLVCFCPFCQCISRVDLILERIDYVTSMNSLRAREVPELRARASQRVREAVNDFGIHTSECKSKRQRSDTSSKRRSSYHMSSIWSHRKTDLMRWLHQTKYSYHTLTHPYIGNALHINCHCRSMVVT